MPSLCWTLLPAKPWQRLRQVSFSRSVAATATSTVSRLPAVADAFVCQGLWGEAADCVSSLVSTKGLDNLVQRSADGGTDMLNPRAVLAHQYAAEVAASQGQRSAALSLYVFCDAP